MRVQADCQFSQRVGLLTHEFVTALHAEFSPAPDPGAHHAPQALAAWQDRHPDRKIKDGRFYGVALPPTYTTPTIDAVSIRDDKSVVTDKAVAALLQKSPGGTVEQQLEFFAR